MKKITRRAFIKTSLGAAASCTVPFLTSCSAVHSRILGANNDIRVAVVGIHSKGKQHIRVFHGLPGVRVVALCDVDQQLLDREKQKFLVRNEKVDSYTDVRKLLDDKNIDAVVFATPNHWHALMGIWACQAGKDVYMEKPVSYNIWEGRKLVEAVRKYKRIVQAGTQNRSDVGFREAVAYIKEGHLGKVLWAHGVWYKQRKPIGKVEGPQPIPQNVDYDLWSGPAPLKPLMRKNLHYDWHWFWTYGNGEMGNLGAHQIDDCRYASGITGFPTRVMSFGGRFAFDDDGETPNTHVAIFDFESTPIIVEVRNLPISKGRRAMDHLRGTRKGNVIQCEHGYFVGGRGGGWVYDNSGKKIKQFPGDGGASHQANFIEAVRSHNPDILRAEILEGHISAALCHIANISYQIGMTAPLDRIKEVIPTGEEMLAGFQRFEEHLAKNEINLEENPAVLGPWLTLDEKKEVFLGEFSSNANKLVRRDVYRKPFVVPEKI